MKSRLAIIGYLLCALPCTVPAQQSVPPLLEQMVEPSPPEPSAPIDSDAAVRRAPNPSTDVAPKRPEPVVPTIGGVQPTLLGQYGAWGAYSASPSGRKVCFALAKPTKAMTNPPNRPRDTIYMFISSRPAERVKNEISIIAGYGYKPGLDATVEVDDKPFAMYTQNNGAWVKNAAEEARVVDLLRSGSKAVVKGMSASGIVSTDTYLLSGLGRALDHIERECK